MIGIKLDVYCCVCGIVGFVLFVNVFFFFVIQTTPIFTLSTSAAATDVYKRRSGAHANSECH